MALPCLSLSTVFRRRLLRDLRALDDWYCIVTSCALQLLDLKPLRYLTPPLSTVLPFPCFEAVANMRSRFEAGLYRNAYGHSLSLAVLPAPIPGFLMGPGIRLLA